MTARETPLFFASGPERLFGVLHAPEAAAGRPAFVFCHPFGEEKLWTQRAFVTFARLLASRGHAVFRFDLPGAGDSGGELRDATLASTLVNIRSAVDYVRGATDAPGVSLLGIRLGATFAALAAEEISDVRQLVLWSPILDGARYMQELLRINLTTQMASFKAIRQDREAMVAAMRAGETVNVDGYELGLPFYSDVSALALAAAPKRFGGPCLIVNVDRQGGAAPAELQQFAAGYPHGTLQSVAEEPFWKEIARFYDQAPNLFAATTQWLDANPR